MGNKKNKFCILTTQRSGSAWLISLLESHPNIKAFYEIFLDRWAGDKPLVSYHNYRQANLGIRPKITFKYLEQLDDYPGEHSTIGFKIMYNQLVRCPEVLAKLALDRYKMIHLIRDNHLDRVISSASMEQNGLIHSKQEVKASSVTLETDSLIKILSWQETQVKWAKTLLALMPNPVLEITYDELAQNKEQTLSKIIDFLGRTTAEHTFQSDRKKVNKGSYQDKIANYEQVAQTLAGTKFEKFLYQ